MHIEAKFYETYYLCSIIDGILTDRFEYLRELEGFHCDGQWAEWLTPYKKYSVFHRFIEYVVHGYHTEQAGKVDIDSRISLLGALSCVPPAIADIRPHKLPIEEAFDRHSIEHLSFMEYLADVRKPFSDANEDDVYDFMNDTWLSKSYEQLMEQTVAEVFHVLFQNRQLLLIFNDYVSSILSKAESSEAEDLDRSLLAANGTLIRVRPPKWAQRAVFYRDRGRCIMCDKDVTGLANLENLENYDHIVSLAQFGLNDISNLQLLCAHCNQVEKKDGDAVTSTRYQSWYSTED